MVFRSANISFLAIATVHATLLPSWPGPRQHDHYNRRTTEPNIPSITNVPTTAFTSYRTGNLWRSENFEPNGRRATTQDSHWNCTKVPIFTWGDVDNGGLGVQITNADTTSRGFFVYHNLCDYIPYKYTWIDANSTEFVSLPAGFAGRIVRGTDEVARTHQVHSRREERSLTFFIVEP